ncbi:DnaD domain-containing protein, partial [Clostridium tetani]
ILLGNELIEIKRGSTHASELKLMDRWNWSKKKVRNFLQLLEKDNMIICEKSKKGTTITIINYEVYQGSRNHRETIKEPQGNHKETIKELLGDHKGYTNNNDNNYNNINNDNNSSGSTPNYIEFFNSNFHLINSYEINILNSFVKDGLSEEVILLALKKAVENNVRTIKYVKSILQNWLENNIKTVEGVKAEEERFKRDIEHKKAKGNVERKDNGAKVDSFNGYQQRTYDGSDGGMTFDDLEKKLLGWK